MGLEFEDDAPAIGRFDVEQNAGGRLVLVARSRTQTGAVERARWYLGALVVFLPALGGAAWGGIAAAFFLGLTGIVFAVIVMVDFNRLASEGSIVVVEHRFDLERGTPESYRDMRSSGRLVVDDRPMALPIHDVRVISETVSKTGAEICRVYVVLEGTVLLLDTTESRVTALRLASLVRKAIGTELPSGHRHFSAAAGGAWTAAFFFVAFVMPLLVAPMATVFAASPLHVALLGGAVVAGLVGMQYALAIPMRAAVADYIERNLRTSKDE